MSHEFIAASSERGLRPLSLRGGVLGIHAALIAMAAHAASGQVIPNRPGPPTPVTRLVVPFVFTAGMVWQVSYTPRDSLIAKTDRWTVVEVPDSDTQRANFQDASGENLTYQLDQEGVSLTGAWQACHLDGTLSADHKSAQLRPLADATDCLVMFGPVVHVTIGAAPPAASPAATASPANVAQSTAQLSILHPGLLGRPMLRVNMTLDSFVKAIQPAMIPAAMPTAPSSGTGTYRIPCVTGSGSATVTETLTTSTGSTVTWSATFYQCNTSGSTLDGSVTYTWTVSSGTTASPTGTMTMTMNGLLTVRKPGQPSVAASFANATKSISWAVSVNSGHGNSVTGGSYTVAMSGTITIGGTAYPQQNSLTCFFSDETCATSFL